MPNFKEELNLLISIIVKPLGTIKTGEISTYKESNMNILFLIITIPVAFISLFITSSRLFESFSFNFFRVVVVTVIISLLSVKFLIPLLYYVLFKYIGKLNVAFEDVSKTLFPIIIIQSWLNYLIGVFLIDPIIKSAIQSVIYLWFLIMISLVIKYRYITGVKKTLVILIIPIILYSFSRFMI